MADFRPPAGTENVSTETLASLSPLKFEFIVVDKMAGRQLGFHRRSQQEFALEIPSHLEFLAVHDVSGAVPGSRQAGRPANKGR